MTLPWPPHYYPEDVAKHATQNGVVAVHTDDLSRWQKQMHDAFDLGCKAAGGTIIPDAARNNFVELALDRDQIDALCLAVDNTIGDGGFTHAQDEALKRFLETVSIFRRRSP